METSTITLRPIPSNLTILLILIGPNFCHKFVHNLDPAYLVEDSRDRSTIVIISYIRIFIGISFPTFVKQAFEFEQNNG